MAYDSVTGVYTPDYTPNPDAYVKKLTKKGLSKAEAASSARYQAQADTYFAPDGPGANIDPMTGGPRTSTGGSSFPAAGTDAGYEYSADKKQRRKRFHDGKGDFTYGPYEPNPDYKDDISTDRKDAFALIKSTLLTYGFTEAEIKELDAFIESIITDVKIGPELAKIKLREQPTYQARFAGNKARVAKGFNALTEAQYLQQETDYAQTLSSYGVGQLSSRSQFATFIENNTSVTEVGRRLNASVRRVKNADPTILENLKRLYPTITDTDIVSYFLKPVETIEELERKTTVAEIGATAQQYKMEETGLTKFEDLQKYGVNLATARAGYSNIAEELPTATKLSNVYNETGITYGQTEAEAEQFKDSAEAKRKKQKLIETEKASFQGSSGVGAAGLSTTYLRKGSSAGQF
jgi:hypothetical protein